MASLNLFIVGLYSMLSMLGVYFCPKQKRWIVLLGTSLMFYAFFVGWKVFIMIGLTWIIFLGGIKVNEKNYWLPLLLVSVLIPLFLHKLSEEPGHFEYYSNQSILEFSIFQIVGLSYFSFNAISYLIDRKRGYVEPERNFFRLLLYLLYFPAIFSGPLHRYKYLTNQFDSIEITNESISKGLRLILWGSFKNLVLAQRIYILMMGMIQTEISGLYYLLIGFLFFLYLYCNFSSFIDFFQGVSELFGIRLKNNFSNRVYLATSRQGFWSGWHITLSEWFRDYFLYSLASGKSRLKCFDLYLVATFILIGLWHEFSLSLALWGLLNGVWVFLERKVGFQNWPYSKLRNFFGFFYHQLINSLIAIVFISAESVSFSRLFDNSRAPASNFLKGETVNMMIIVFCFLVMDLHNYLAKSDRFDDYLGKRKVAYRWGVYFKLALIILLFGKSGAIENYYIQF